MAEDRDVRFVTEESFDFGILSHSDRMKRRTRRAWVGGPGAGGGGSGRWSPLRGAHLEEMVREATRLAAQLEGCHLPPPAPGDPPGPAATPPGTPRSPRRQTFVVKDSPVRALLPTVESQAPPPAKTRGGPAATAVPKASPRREGASLPAPPPPASPTPGARPPRALQAVPQPPAPSPRCPPGPLRRVAGPPPPEAREGRGGPPSPQPRPARRDPPLPACGPPARRQ
ncbi:proline/serine-rich coiled-coil protein 1 [Corapipo altera]|uniref:proline/serine-rich coiled-coil protein 1 n=1 Tax=Corapipo altera TaxID=415028 RepID=UPI000FD66BE0|nr:proline/serine-rich coiled-coil protein 1 [Corapipo altera]